MTHTEQAIQKAIEGGYKYYGPDKSAFPFEWLIQFKEVLFLDPLFWQCLGKSLGWWEKESASGDFNPPLWKVYWHDFIDHLAEGKDAESFFAGLLAK